MTIRIFNPDHDLALAADMERFTAPHAGRQIRCDLGFISSLWADDGDVVIVDDIDAAESMYRKLKFERKPKVEFATMMQIEAVLRDLNSERPAFDVWGWNKSIRFQFIQAGVPLKYLPSLDELDEIRILSGRQQTTSLLHSLRTGLEEVTCGESHYCTSFQDVVQLRHSSDIYRQCVVKAPWSSSGRGVRYIIDNDEPRHIENTFNWIRNTIAQQGGVMVEPYFNKVKDFALEFEADGKGGVTYCGLSLFETVNGAYTGNILATEDEKREILSRYIRLDLLDETISRITDNVKTGPYKGPFGVDMMIVGNGKFLLHPCVEINLRRTMGHVALVLSPTLPSQGKSMSVAYTAKKYHLEIRKTNNTNEQ